MEKLYNNHTADMSPSAVYVDYYKTVSDIKTEAKISKKINSDPNGIFYVLAAMFTVFSVPFFKNYYENFVLRHQTLFYSVPYALFGVLFLIIAFICAFLPYYIDTAGVRHFNRYPHKNRPYQFTADTDGIVVASYTYSARIEWRDITDIVEHKEGFFISWGRNRVFLPGKYLTVEKVSKLRNYFKYFCGSRIWSLGDLEPSEVVFPCEKFEMCPLVGECRFSVEGNDSREKFERSTRIIWRHSYIKFALIFMPMILIAIAILILGCSKLIIALAIIAAAAVLSEMIFRYTVRYIAKETYRENAKYVPSVCRVYENAVMFEANGLVRLIEYKNIRSVRDCEGDILIISTYADAIRISECTDSEEIMNYITIKAMR